MKRSIKRTGRSGSVVLAVLGATTLAPGAARAVVVQGYDSATNDRFTSGYPAAPVPSTASQFIGATYDWSGVGWDASLATRSVTMISSQYFVFSTHYQPGATIKFLSPTLNAANLGNSSAAVVSYTWSPGPTTRFVLLDPTSGVAGDFSVGKLNTPLDPAQGIATYRILSLASLADYVDLPLLTYGRGNNGTSPVASPRVGTDTLGGFMDLDIYPLGTGNQDRVSDTFSVYHTDNGQPGNTRYETGDSSSPLFVPYNGDLALIGTHGTAGFGPDGKFYSTDSFIPAYLDQMTEHGIEFATVPEPGAAEFCAGLALAGFAAWHRVNRRREG